jgi:hypothetical protein
MRAFCAVRNADLEAVAELKAEMPPVDTTNG